MNPQQIEIHNGKVLCNGCEKKLGASDPIKIDEINFAVYCLSCFEKVKSMTPFSTPLKEKLYRRINKLIEKSERKPENIYFLERGIYKIKVIKEKKQFNLL